MTKKLITAFLIFLTVLFTLFGCTKKDGSEKLCEFLFAGGYEAEFDYSFYDGQELSGSAKVKKSDKVRIDFLSPDTLSSLSVESDEMGEPGVLIFNYYGMRAPLPDGALSKVSLLLSFFSDEIPKGILSDKASVSTYTDEKGEFDKDIPLKICTFSGDDGADITVVFDASNGFPVRFSAVRDTKTVQITFTKLIPPDSVSAGSNI